jgi:hypothetical protein
MAHRVAPEAEAELDHIRYCVAKESVGIEVADPLIYRVEEQDVLILHVFRGSRDIEALLRQ